MPATFKMPRVRRLAAIITTIRTAMTHRFGRSTPSTALPLHRELHQAVRFWPIEPGDDDALPAIELKGIFVFLYYNPDSAEVHVSVDCDGADQRLRDDDGTVPLHINVGHNTVFRA